MQTPIYQQIKNEMIEEISKLSANSSIASERDLAVKYNVSRMTMRKAISELVEEGYLYREKNKGTFVADKKLRKKNTSSLIFIEKKENVKYDIINFDIKSASWNMFEEAVKKLNITDESSLLTVIRLITLNKRPQSVEEIYISMSNISENDLKDLKKLLDLNRYVEEGSITQTFIPMIVPPQYAKILNLSMDSPIILVNNMINTKDGRPLIYVKSYNNPNERVIEITT